jgi:hypothetical protein
MKLHLFPCSLTFSMTVLQAAMPNFPVEYASIVKESLLKGDDPPPVCANDDKEMMLVLKSITTARQTIKDSGMDLCFQPAFLRDQPSTTLVFFVCAFVGPFTGTIRKHCLIAFIACDATAGLIKSQQYGTIQETVSQEK